MVLDVGLGPRAGLVDHVVAGDAPAGDGVPRAAAQLVRPGAVDVLVEFLLEEVDHLAGVEAQVASIGREHSLGVAALGHALEVALLKRDEDVLSQLEDARRLLAREPELAPALKQHLAETRTWHLLLDLPVRSFLNLQILEGLLVEKHLARL